MKKYLFSLLSIFFILKSFLLLAAEDSQVKITAVSKKNGEVEILVMNERVSAVSLNTVIQVEQKKSDIFETVKDVSELLLRSSCSSQVHSCLVLKPKETLKTASWKMMGDAQCTCEKCWPIPEGGYRLVLTSCDGKEIFKSSPFRAGKSK